MSKRDNDSPISEGYYPHVLLWGVLPNFDPQEISEDLLISPVRQILIEGLRAAEAAGFTAAPLIERYSALCRCEIAPTEQSSYQSTEEYKSDLQVLTSLCTLIGQYTVIGLAACNYSWDRIADAGLNPGTELPPFVGGLQRFAPMLMEEYYTEVHSQNAPIKAMTQEHIQTLQMYFAKSKSIYQQSPAFQLAMVCIGDFLFIQNQRARIALLWSAIEGLFGIDAELRFRLSVLIACLTTAAPGEDRVEKFNKVKRLYDIRSRAVHGGDVAAEVLDQAMADSFLLLSELLKWHILHGSMLSPQECTEILLASKQGIQNEQT